jgi:GT2 family glycosyltransferase
MNTYQSKIAIVTVLAFDKPKEVKSFLNEISRINYDNLILILVINNPGLTWLPRMINKYDDIILIEMGSNAGVCETYNIGIKRAIKEKAAYTMLLNRDVKITKDIIGELDNVISKNSDAAMVSPVIMKYHQPNMIDYAGGYFSRVFYYYKVNRQMSVLDIKSAFAINSIDCCCVLIKNKLMKKIGWFDEDLFLYFDDPDISMKVNDTGYKCYLLPKPLVRHMKKSTRFAPYEAYYFGRNPFIMIHKHAKGMYKISGYFGQFFIRLPRNAIRMQSFRAFYMYLVGMLDGIRGVTGKAKFF